MKKTRSFAYAPESVPAARRFAVQALKGVDGDVLDAIKLMVSELATNSIRHARTAFDLAVIHAAGQVRVEVTDRADGWPAMRSPRPEEPTGRGLRIVNMLSAKWGIDQTGKAGKTVWFMIDASPAGSPADASRT